MLNQSNLEQFIKQSQTNPENIIREYCQHLFLSYLYRLPGSERLFFKGGTALRIVFRSPRFSEDLDFTGINISQSEVEELFTDALANIEKTAIGIKLEEGKPTTGGYLGQASFRAYGKEIDIWVEVSLRRGKSVLGVRSLIENEYVPAYSLVHLPAEDLIQGKMDALAARHKPRDFYDYFFLLCGNYPIVKEKENLSKVLKLLRESKIDFKSEIRQFLPKSQAMFLKDFKKILEQKIFSYLGKE